MKKFNKMLSVILSLVLCLSMVAPALAATFNDLQAAIDSEDATGYSNGVSWSTTEDQRNITLNESVTQGENDLNNITVSGNVTLDLNGNTVEGSYSGFYTDGMIDVQNGASLTVKDTSGEQTGEIRNSNGVGTNTVVVHGEMTLESGTIAADSVTQKGVFVDGGSFTMNDGRVEGGSQAAAGIISGTLNVNGGTVFNENTSAVSGQGGTINVGGNAVITSETEAGVHSHQGNVANISGGTITGGSAGVSATHNGTLNLTGGTIHATNENVGDISIVHGTNTVTIAPGVEFETLSILGSSDGEKSNTIIVEGKYQITYGSDRKVIITALDGSEVPPVLYDIVKKMVVKNGDEKSLDGNTWESIILGPDAVKNPWNQIPNTKVNYEYTDDVPDVDYPAAGPTVAAGLTIETANGKWTFDKWPTVVDEELYDENGKLIEEDVYVVDEYDEDGNYVGSYTAVETTDEDGNSVMTAKPLFDKDGKHLDEVTVKGGWQYKENPPASPVISNPVDEVELEDEDIPLAGLFTRGDAIGYLWEQSGSPEWELSDFEDVPEDHQWAVAIGWAQAMGIAVADEDGNFRPDDLVLRSTEDVEGELQEFLNRYAVYAGIKLDADELFIELAGAPDDIIMGEEAQVIFNDFFAKLEAALSQAA